MELTALGIAGAYTLATGALSSGIGKFGTLVAAAVAPPADDAERARAGVKPRSPRSPGGGSPTAGGGNNDIRELIDAIKAHRTPIQINVDNTGATGNINTFTGQLEESLKGVGN